MSIAFHKLKISDLRRETPDAVSIAFAIPDTLRDAYRFSPGQHLTLRTSEGGQELRRSYSICAGMDDNELRIAVKKLRYSLEFLSSALPAKRVAPHRKRAQTAAGQLRSSQ